MSMHGFTTRVRRRSKRAAFVFFLLGGFLIALPLLLMIATQTARASSTVNAALGKSQALDFAGVSVVRLVSTYKPVDQLTNATPANFAQCTGLGVIVSSWQSQSGTDDNNWIMTDGNLVNPLAPSCLPKPSAVPLTLASVDIYFNTTFNATSTPSLQVLSPSVHCLAITCNGSPALVSFQSNSALTYPHVDLASSALVASMSIPLGLASASASLPAPSNTNPNLRDQYPQQAQTFLTERMGPAKVSSGLEAGTPIFNQAGELTDIMLSGNVLLPVADLASTIGGLPSITPLPSTHAIEIAPTPSVNITPTPPASIPTVAPFAHTNAVYDDWKKGVASYYGRDYATARTAFEVASHGNALFTAPVAFEQLVATQSSHEGKQPPAQAGIRIKYGFIDITIPDVKMLIVLVVAVLGVLLVFVIALLVRGRVRNKRRFKEYEELNHRAELEAQRITAAEQEAQRITAMEEAQAQHTQQWQPPASPAFSPGKVTTSPLSPSFSCPTCGASVRPEDKFCANCRSPLMPTDSGFHIRAMKPPAPPIQHSPVPLVRSLADQPTLDMSHGMYNEQPTLELAQNASPSNEQPTLEIPFSGNGQTDVEKTVTYGLATQQVKGQRLGFAVGTRSDPGIKRKHKPNEDSMFAAQWQPDTSAESLPFGLFVVADGMGGHANGQDASRTAIQTIIDFMLPKLDKIATMSSDELKQLLVSAVEHANLMVHQHNMELRADMGTTVTATLVVGATAYVTNVGDSRTYLYRAPDGLKKVTNDHSVVASLVEAGIIKPDDIYTHPKRNQIYRSLGEKASVEVDSFVVQLQPGDKLLLCSDGLWDMVRDPQIESVLKAPVPDPNVAASALIQAALDGGGEDNVSVIVISLTETPQRSVGHGIQLLAKPDAVHMPQL